MMLSSNTETSPKIGTGTTFLPYIIWKTPFLYPPLGFVSKQVLATITLPHMAFAIPVWYLVPLAMLGSPGITSIGITPITPQEVTVVNETPIATPITTTKKINKKRIKLKTQKFLENYNLVHYVIS